MKETKKINWSCLIFLMVAVAGLVSTPVMAEICPVGGECYYDIGCHSGRLIGFQIIKNGTMYQCNFLGGGGDVDFRGPCHTPPGAREIYDDPHLPITNYFLDTKQMTVSEDSLSKTFWNKAFTTHASIMVKCWEIKNKLEKNEEQENQEEGGIN